MDSEKIEQTETAILFALKNLNKRSSLPEVIKEIQTYIPGIEEKYIRPVFWSMASNNTIKVDISFHAVLPN